MARKAKSNTETANTNATAPAPNGTPQGAPGTPPVVAPVVLLLTTLTYEQVLEAAPDEQDRLMKSFHGSTRRLAETRDEVKTASKYAAILLAGVETRVKRGIDNRIYASTFTASDLYKQVTGEKPPGHVWTMKNTYNNYVLTHMISEADFIGNRNNCLELAQRICDAVFENDPASGLTHDAVRRAAVELKTRNDNEAKVLRSILDSVKPAKPMTAEQALEAFEEICASGNLPVCFAQLPDEMAKLPEQFQKEAYIACDRSFAKVENLLGEKAEAWITAAKEATMPVQVTNGAAPASTPSEMTNPVAA